jgi:beta-1,4-mannosyl-glycoprotein beta-1,4-N-acetylglucosaminyltransferase
MKKKNFLNKMKVYDCFNFFNEIDLLEIRLNELDDVVDYFVIVESEKTHQNNPKPLYYQEISNNEKFIKFKDKIINIVVKGDKFRDDTWYNEKYQFNSILDGLISAEDEDIIILGAADEIPRNSVIKSIKENYNGDMYVLLLNFYYFYLDTKYNHNGRIDWNGNLLIKKKNINVELYEILKVRQYHQNIIPNGGWHFSFMGNAKHAITKINSYAHNEFKHINEDAMNTLLEDLRDPLGRDGFTNFFGYEPIENLPFYVQNNLELFKKNLHQFLKK